jgi:hypothetical protein
MQPNSLMNNLLFIRCQKLHLATKVSQNFSKNQLESIYFESHYPMCEFSTSKSYFPDACESFPTILKSVSLLPDLFDAETAVLTLLSNHSLQHPTHRSFSKLPAKFAIVPLFTFDGFQHALC